MNTVVIVHSGGANLASLGFAFRRLGVRARVTHDAQLIARADRVVLPGVGAAGAAMRRLTLLGLIPVLRTLSQPVLGICLGMQLLFRRSEEDDAECLGILPQAVGRLACQRGLPVPHMGWNRLRHLAPDPLIDGIAGGSHVYFVHSYAVGVDAHTLASCEYGQILSAVVRVRNFWGTQFHPERSGPIGARILQNFLNL